MVTTSLWMPFAEIILHKQIMQVNTVHSTFARDILSFWCIWGVLHLKQGVVALILKDYDRNGHM
eukprot:5324724-Amphidinium_carterae.1